jgi:hypothetical protein
MTILILLGLVAWRSFIVQKEPCLQKRQRIFATDAVKVIGEKLELLERVGVLGTKRGVDERNK